MKKIFILESATYALLEACKAVLMTPEIYIIYHHPYEPSNEIYIKVIEELHSKNKYFA